MKPLAKVEIIRCDGRREQHEVGRHILLDWIKRMIEAESIDTVNLREGFGGPHTGFVMIVDDNGWETETIQHDASHIEIKPIRPRKPINSEATKLYHAQCRPGATHQIAGDVAIAWDKDFA